jgi:hypothetical protein
MAKKFVITGTRGAKEEMKKEERESVNKKVFRI